MKMLLMCQGRSESTGAAYLQHGSLMQSGGNLTISNSQASNQGGAGSLWGAFCFARIVNPIYLI